MALSKSESSMSRTVKLRNFHSTFFSSICAPQAIVLKFLFFFSDVIPSIWILFHIKIFSDLATFYLLVAFCSDASHYISAFPPLHPAGSSHPFDNHDLQYTSSSPKSTSVLLPKDPTNAVVQG